MMNKLLCWPCGRHDLWFGLLFTVASTTIGLIGIASHGQNMTIAARNLNATLPHEQTTVTSIAGLNAQNIDNYQLMKKKQT
jgi:hypothetical protein